MDIPISLLLGNGNLHGMCSVIHNMSSVFRSGGDFFVLFLERRLDETAQPKTGTKPNTFTEKLNQVSVNYKTIQRVIQPPLSQLNDCSEWR